MITTLDTYLTQTEIKNEEQEKNKQLEQMGYTYPENMSKSKKECILNGYRDMTTKEIAKLIRKDFKKEFDKTIKFSVRTDYNSITAKIKAISTEHLMTKEEFKEYMICSNHFDEMNYDYYMKAYETKKFKKYHLKEETYEKIMQIMNKYNYDNSDSMTDYFDVNYYDHFDFDWQGVEVL